MKKWTKEYTNEREEKYWTEMLLDGKMCTAYISFYMGCPRVFRICVWDKTYDHGGNCLLDNWFRVGTDGVELESDGCRLTALTGIEGLESLERHVLEIVIPRLVREL